MSNTLTTVTPVLSSTVGYINDVRDQIASLLRYVLVNPGFTSSLWESDLVSFRVLSSAYDHNPNELLNRLDLGLTSIYRRCFPDYSIDNKLTLESYEDRDGVMVRIVDATSEFDPSLAVRYSITFQITILSSISDLSIEESLAIVSGTFTVDPTTNIITVSFANSMDTDFITNT